MNDLFFILAVPLEGTSAATEINWLDEPESQACSRLMHLISVDINPNEDGRAREELLISAE